MMNSMSAAHAAAVAPVGTPLAPADDGRVVERRNVGPVRRVVLNGPGDLLIAQAAQDTLEVEAEAALLPRMSTVVREGTLYLDVSVGRMRHHRPIRYRLGVRALEAIVARGAGMVVVSSLRAGALAVEVGGRGHVRIGTLLAERLHASLVGQGDLHIEGGAVASQRIHVAGIGSYLAERLESRDTSLSLDGSGDARILARTSLGVEITGQGDVVYRGSPRLTHWLVGGGRLVRAEAQTH